MKKSPKQLERHLKGVANHRRIEILEVVKRNDGVTLERISEILECNFKTISEHTKKLVQAGLINKKYQGRAVMHTLSPYGEKMLRFIREF